MAKRDRAEYMRQRRAANKNNEQKDTPNNRAAEIEAEMREAFERNMGRLETGLKETQPGSNAHRNLVEAIAKLERDYRKERAERGLDPERLGAAGKTSYHFVAMIARDGSVHTEEVPAEKLEQVLKEESKKNHERLVAAGAYDPERLAMCAELNKEYGFDETGRDTSYDSTKKEKDDDSTSE
jgi:hypothetical protein